MSTYADAWHAMQPPIRDFYRNHAFLNTRFSTPHFTTFGFVFYRRRGIDLSSANFAYQLRQLPRVDINRPVILNFSLWDDLPYSLPCDDFAWSTTFQQFATVPAYAFEYPRTKFKVPRSYWTGAPRRRRNLA